MAVQNGGSLKKGVSMTSKKAVIQLLLFCGAIGLSSCAGKPPVPTVAEVSQAELAVQQASKSKAPDYASLELYTAREQLDAAKEAMQSQAEALGKAAQKLGEVMYAESQAKAQPAGGGGGGGEPKKDEKVVDAEYTEVDDKK